MMEDDDPLKQVHAAKEAVAAEYGYNIAAMVEAFRTKDAADTTRQIVKAPPRLSAGGDGFTTIAVPNELLPAVRKLMDEWQKV